MNLTELKIGDLVAKIPIIQGGMGVGISLSGLAAAVANEGGIGVIASDGIFGSLELAVCKCALGAWIELQVPPSVGGILAFEYNGAAFSSLGHKAS